MTNKEYANEILDIIGNVSITNDAIYQLVYDLYQKLGGEESQDSLDTIYKELKAAIGIWDNTDDLEISKNGKYSLLRKNIIVNVPSEQKNNEIWYTSSNGNIVKPSQASALPTIVSNTYIGGKGIIKFESDVTSIGGEAFYMSSYLTSMSLPNSVKSIGGAAFQYCGSLTSVTIPNSVTKIGDWAFYSCVNLTSVTIPNGITSIGEYTFSNCRSLTSVTIPNNVKNIRNGAFYECAGLTSVTIPNSVTNIGNVAFYNCKGLTSILYTGKMEQWNAITKGTDWNSGVPATVVHCKDGDIQLQEPSNSYSYGFLGNFEEFPQNDNSGFLGNFEEFYQSDNSGLLGHFGDEY